MDRKTFHNQFVKFTVGIDHDSCTTEMSKELLEFFTNYLPSPGDMFDDMPKEPGRYVWRGTYWCEPGGNYGGDMVDADEEYIGTIAKDESVQVLNLNTCPNDTDGDGDCHRCAHLIGKCKAFRQLAWLAEMEKPNERTALHLKYFKGFTTPEKVNRKFIRCINFLEDLFGLHHVHQPSLFKNDCTNPWCEILLYGGASFATTDGSQLTNLVLMAHDHCIRVDISPCNMKYLKIALYPRDSRDGGWSDQHKTIETVLADWRSRHPYDSTSPQ